MKYISLFSIFLILFSCSKNKNIDPVLIIPFTNKKADTLKEKNYITIFDNKTGGKGKLSKTELKIINRNLIIGVNNYNDTLKIRLESWNKKDKSYKWNYEKEKLNLRYYFRQYFIDTNEQGDKIIYVFCLCSVSGEIWRNEKISVMDGGSCYLNATINITKNKIEYFGTHGLA